MQELFLAGDVALENDSVGVRYNKSLRLVKFVLWFTSMKFIYIVVEIVKG